MAWRDFVEDVGLLQTVVLERAVSTIVRELTDRTDVDAATPLMDAGIDSLAATELGGRLRDMSGVEITATAMFDHPTPRALASHLVEKMLCSAAAVPQAAQRAALELRL